CSSVPSSLRMRRPPTSPLFPYTTLFRSLLQLLALQQERLSASDRAARTVRAAQWQGRSHHLRVQHPDGKAHLLQGLRRSSVLRRSEEHTSELQSPDQLVCRLLLEKKKNS